jgi:hypothetical protein
MSFCWEVKVSFISQLRLGKSAACLMAVLGVGLAGCQNGGGASGGSGNQQPVSDHKTAPEAWKDLENRAMMGNIARVFVHNDILLVFEAAKQKANQQATVAIHEGNLPIEAINAMVEDIAQDMVKTLPEVPEVKNSQNQLILAFSSDLRDTGGSGNAKLKVAMDSLRHSLSKNEKMTDNFVFVSTTEDDAEKLKTKISGADTSVFRDPLQRTPDTTHPVKYAPQSIFLITGSLNSVNDTIHHTIQISLTLDFTHVLSRRSLQNTQFTRTYMWHPELENWELQP